MKTKQLTTNEGCMLAIALGVIAWIIIFAFILVVVRLVPGM
jgi:hypothetical protein